LHLGCLAAARLAGNEHDLVRCDGFQDRTPVLRDRQSRPRGRKSHDLRLSLPLLPRTMLFGHLCACKQSWMEDLPVSLAQK